MSLKFQSHLIDRSPFPRTTHPLGPLPPQGHLSVPGSHLDSDPGLALAPSGTAESHSVSNCCVWFLDFAANDKWEKRGCQEFSIVTGGGQSAFLKDLLRADCVHDLLGRGAEFLQSKATPRLWLTLLKCFHSCCFLFHVFMQRRWKGSYWQVGECYFLRQLLVFSNRISPWLFSSPSPLPAALVPGWIQIGIALCIL